MLERIHHQSPNFEQRPVGTVPDLIILHYTDMNSAEEALERLCDPEIKVSSHFLITKEGVLFQLVDPAHRAWHAGVSSWQGEKDINSRSIGIELDNLGHTFGPEPFPENQIKTLIELLSELTSVYGIPAHRIIGHSDVAPLRKKDPGELFPWAILAEKGFGIWPISTQPSALPGPMSVIEVQNAMIKIGYSCPQTGIWDENSQKVCYTFQQHFTPQELTGHPTELTYQVLRKILKSL